MFFHELGVLLRMFQKSLRLMTSFSFWSLHKSYWVYGFILSPKDHISDLQHHDVGIVCLHYDFSIMKPHRIKCRQEAPNPQFCPLVTSFMVRFLSLNTEGDSRWFDSLFSSCSPRRIEGDFDKDEYELMFGDNYEEWFLSDWTEMGWD